MTFKAHIALNVTNIEKSVNFYQAMFGVAPVKYKVDYAKFDLDNPTLNLTLNQVQTIQADGTLSHLGFQVGSTEEVQAAVQRFNAAGLNLFEEKNTDCCYALQDKVWVTDPDGIRWEIFVVKVSDTTPDQNISLNPGKVLIQTEAKPPCCT